MNLSTFFLLMSLLSLLLLFLPRPPQNLVQFVFVAVQGEFRVHLWQQQTRLLPLALLSLLYVTLNC